MELGRPLQPRFQSNRLYRGNKERDKRRRENLCYNCGKSGYRAKEYNSKPERLHAINDEIFDMIEKKADTIMKLEETLIGLDIVQRQEFRETPREENISNLGVFAKALDKTTIISKVDVKNMYLYALLDL